MVFSFGNISFDMTQSCWQANPFSRDSISEQQKILTTFLEESKQNTFLQGSRTLTKLLPSSYKVTGFFVNQPPMLQDLLRTQQTKRRIHQQPAAPHTKKARLVDHPSDRLHVRLIQHGMTWIDQRSGQKVAPSGCFVTKGFFTVVLVEWFLVASKKGRKSGWRFVHVLCVCHDCEMNDIVNCRTNNIYSKTSK